MDSILSTVLLPISLVIIMLGMGLSLVVKDFKNILLMPKAIIIGLVNQLLLLPLIAFAIALGFSLSNELAIGLMLIAACPGGVTSNLISHLSRGDTALSITLTAVSSFITLLTIPLYVSLAFQYFNDKGIDVPIDALGMLLQILVIVIIPVSIGMCIRHYKEAFALKMDKPVRIFSTILFILIIVSIIIQERESIIEHFTTIGLAAATLNILTMALGYFSAKIFQLNLKQSITIAIESGVQNGTLAIVIASTILANTYLSIPAAIYSLIMFISGGLMIFIFSRRKGIDQPLN